MDDSDYVEDIVSEDLNMTESESDHDYFGSDSPVYSFRDNPASILGEENFQMFEKLGHDVVLSQAQNKLLQVMSALHFAKHELLAYQEAKKRIEEEIESVKLKRKQEMELFSEVMAAKDRGLKELKRSLGTVVASLKTRKKEQEREIERLEKQVELAPRRAYVNTRWELIQQWKRGEADKWNAKQAELEFREVMAAEARINGLPPPVFPESLTDFGDADSAS